jgi:hypothetical protein
MFTFDFFCDTIVKNSKGAPRWMETSFDAVAIGARLSQFAKDMHF